MEVHPDQKYIDALLKNDTVLLGEIYTTMGQKVERWICSNSGTSDDAADMMQEALIAIARQARRPQGLTLTCPFSNYLMMVLRGKWFNELKRRKHTQVTMDESKGLTDTHFDMMEQAEASLAEDAKLNLFRSFFEKLPAGCQKLIRLSWSSLSMEEVAEKLEVSYGYARKRKSQCVAKLIAAIQGSPQFAALKLNF